MKKRIALLTLFFFLIATFAACTTIDPDTGERKLTKAATGAGLGALGGALIGALLGGGNRKAVLIGAGIGALAGGVVGDYMDKQEAELREATKGTGVEVERYGDRIKLNMPANVTFDTGSANVKSGFDPILDKIAQSLSENNKTYVDVIGHTDSVGTAETNLTLSNQRADSVARSLESRGVHPARIETIGFGETRPIATNDTPEGRSMNRRVEIVLTPVT